MVHCHVGSLEMFEKNACTTRSVHCHVGSLENRERIDITREFVHCHVGSLEKNPATQAVYSPQFTAM